MQQLVEQTPVGSILARTGTGVANAGVDLARDGSVSGDSLVHGLVDRLFHRKDGPLGPPLLVGTDVVDVAGR